VVIDEAVFDGDDIFIEGGDHRSLVTCVTGVLGPMRKPRARFSHHT
jgi:prolyl-tRNA editing enzyme YbaK/EbsC (Cys-tRNA(Pro) deacylase)